MPSESAKTKWNPEIESQLIDLVNTKEHLWNTKSALYSKRNLKRSSYEEIVEHLKTSFPDYAYLFTSDAVLNKFQNMRTYFQKELKKLKQLKSGAGSQNISSKWIHFERMLFLQETLEASSSRSNLDLADSQMCEVICNLEIEREVDDNFMPDESTFVDENSEVFVMEPSIEESSISTITENRKCQTGETGRSGKKKRKLSCQNMEHLLQEASNSLSLLNSSQDSDDTFGTHVAASLKMIKNEKNREMAKLKIMETITEYRFKDS